MAVVGNAESWADTFREDLIPVILELVISVWNRFDKPKSGENEVTISKRLCAALRKEKNYKRLPVRIDLETPELDSETGEVKGRIDLRFTDGNYRDEIYYSLECKILNIVRGNKIGSGAYKYITEGMMRYISGKYAASLTKGGMIGYVMDGNIVSAIESVNNSIKNKRIELKIKLPHELSPSTLRPQCDKTRETTHELDKGDFVIHHIFLPA